MILVRSSVEVTILGLLRRQCTHTSATSSSLAAHRPPTSPDQLSAWQPRPLSATFPDTCWPYSPQSASLSSAASSVSSDARASTLSLYSSDFLVNMDTNWITFLSPSLYDCVYNYTLYLSCDKERTYSVGTSTTPRSW